MSDVRCECGRLSVCEKYDLIGNVEHHCDYCALKHPDFDLKSPFWKMTEKVKMYCIFSREVLPQYKGSRGKFATQAGHGYLHSYWDAVSSRDRDKNIQATFYRLSERAYKISLVVDDASVLETIRDSYADRCGVSLVEDAGFTVFEKPTVTCLGVGPLFDYNVSDDIRSLKVLT